MGLQVTPNRLDQRSASPQFKQPSSTSTVSLSTASLSTSTTKSDAMHEYLFDHDRLDAYRLSSKSTSTSTSTSTTNSQNQALHRSLRSFVFGLRQSQLLGSADRKRSGME
ncbi:MAG: hypothetical protein NT168_10525 [Planctomycetota bacterium]|nr:hypothetical protein [Planctomycetota bacterium]